MAFDQNEMSRTKNALAGRALAQDNVAEADVDKLVYCEFFGDDFKGTFVDVGGARPDFLSISALYRRKGWRVVVVEPNPVFAGMHRALGHEIMEYAAGRENRDDCDFSVVDLQSVPDMIYQNGQISFESSSALEIKPGYGIPNGATVTKIKVRQRRLDSILAEVAAAQIDAISIDVEGWELEVLDGLDLQKHRPRVFIIENYLRNSAYDAYMAERGYTLWRALFPNQVFVDREAAGSVLSGSSVAG
jgi:FkbM family methyltransferase